MAAARLWAFRRAGGPVRARRDLGPPGARRCPEHLRQRFQRPGRVVGPGGEGVHLAPLGHQGAGQVGVGEERHRGEGVGQHQVPGPLELGDGELGQIAEPLDGGDPRTALDAGRERLAQELGPRGPGDPVGRSQAPPPEGVPSHQEHGGLPRAQGLGRLGHGVVGDRVQHRAGVTRGGLAGLPPRHVGRDDQRGHAPGRSEGTLDGGDGVRSEGVGGPRRAEPPRHRPGQALDVRGERGVVRDVGRGVVADHVHHRGAGPPGVVEVGDAVAEARPEVEQGGGGPARHPAVSVGGSGDDAFEEPEDPPHLGDVVEGGHEVHLRGPGVGEAHVDPAGHEGPDQCLGAVHDCTVQQLSRAGCRGRGSRGGRRRV